MAITGDQKDEPRATLTIEQVAAEAALPVSTLRMYQHRGLLAPPEKRGRVGFYGPEHLARLSLIAELQERGFSLASIKELADGLEDGRSLNDVLGLTSDDGLWAAEEPVVIEVGDLVERFSAIEITPALLARVVDLGLVELTDDGRVRVMSPRFLEIGTRLGALGIPTAEVIDEYEALRVAADDIAARFTSVFERHVWDPLTAGGVSADHVAGIAASLEQLGQLAQAVVDLTLAQAVQRRAQVFLDQQAAELTTAARPTATRATGPAEPVGAKANDEAKPTTRTTKARAAKARAAKARAAKAPTARRAAPEG